MNVEQAKAIMISAGAVMETAHAAEMAALEAGDFDAARRFLEEFDTAAADRREAVAILIACGVDPF